MPLNDIARCAGEPPPELMVLVGGYRTHKCPRRETCARYVERHTGGERTPKCAYLCSEDDESYIPVEQNRDQ